MSESKSARLEDLPDRYWHCAVWGRTVHQEGAIETDLRLHELKRRILDPWRKGNSFVVNGAIFSSPHEPKKILITCSEHPSSYYSERDDADEAARVAQEDAEGSYIIGLSFGGSRYSGLYAGTDYTSRLLFESVEFSAENEIRRTAANEETTMKTVAENTDTQKDKPITSRPTMFIGSTVEGLNIAREVAAELEHDLDVTIWNQDLYTAGGMTWTLLVEQAGSFDYALLIFGADDRVESRGVENLAVRDNVLIEYGLFVGVIGPRRTFFLFNRDHKPKIASDLAGVTPVTYRDRPDGNLRAAVGTACNEIRKLSNRLGRRGVQNP